MASEPMIGDGNMVERIRAATCTVSGCTSFAELATLALARQLQRKGRRTESKRILRAYLRSHPSTPRIEAAWKAAT